MTGWATVDEIGRMFDWTPAYVRRLASEEQWRRTGYNPRRYSLVDAYRHACLTGRLPQGTK